MKGITLKHFAELISLAENAPNDENINKLLQQVSNKKFITHNLDTMLFSDFVDLERFLEEMNYIEFCRIFVKKFFWQTIYVHNLFFIIEDYGKKKIELFEKYQYCFNPPQYGEVASATVGSELRQEFVREFGTYTVLTDRICQHQNVNFKQIENWTTEEVFYWANYYSGQKIIENIK
jgi:hypothetical protein